MKKYLVYVRNSVHNTFAYRGAIAVWIISNMLSLLVVIFLWLAASAGSALGGYTKNELITYYISGLFLQWLTNWFPFYWIKDEIADGSIVGSALLRPISYYWRTFFIETGWHIVTIFVGLFATLLFIFPLSRYFIFVPSLTKIILTAASIILCIFVMFTFSMCMGLLAFWLTKIDTVDSLLWISKGLLGGLMIPLGFLPPIVKSIAIFLPFRYMYSFPLELYLGRLNIAEIFTGFVIGALWIMVLAMVYSVLWTAGRKAYTSFGN